MTLTAYQQSMAEAHVAAEHLYQQHVRFCRRCLSSEPCAVQQRLYETANRAEQRAIHAGIPL